MNVTYIARFQRSICITKFISSKFRFFRPCVKRYLLSNVRSRFIKINSDTWDLALFLPTERFIKANKTKVFRDSREAVGR